MLTTSETGNRILSSLSNHVILRFLERSKNSQDVDVFTNLRYIADYIVEPYKILPYNLFWYDGATEEVMSSYLQAIVNKKLVRYIPIISNMDANTFLPDVTKSFIEEVTEENELNSFNMSENSPINAVEEIDTPNIKNKATNGENKQLNRTYKDPHAEIKVFNFSKEFSTLLVHIIDAVESIIKEFNQLY